MNWEVIGIIADVAAAVAVIVSVIYLATQIRQSTKAAQAESSRGTSDGDGAMLAVAQDPELAKIFVRGLSSLASLDRVEHIRFVYTLGIMIGSVGRNYEYVTLGFVTESRFKDRNIGHLDMLESPGGSEFWRTLGHTFPPEFRAFVAREVNLKPPKITPDE